MSEARRPAAAAYRNLARALTLPSLIKSMCGVWDKHHVVTMEVSATRPLLTTMTRTRRDQDVIARGRGTSLLWMMVPGCVAPEASHFSREPLLVTKRLPLETKLWQRKFNAFWALLDWML